MLSEFDRGSFSTVENKPDGITKLLQKDTERLNNLIDAQPAKLPQGTCRSEKEFELDLKRSIPSNK